MKAIIVDIDGTICHKCDREYWEYDKVKDDSVNYGVVDILRAYDGYLFIKTEDKAEVVLITSRKEDSREVTLDWLLDNNIPFDKLYMRPNNDTREDWKVKKDIYNNIKDKYEVVAVFEDNEECCQMYKDEGLTVFKVI